MTVPIVVSPLDPNCLLQGLSRAMVGPLIWTPVTFDQDFGSFGRWIWVGSTGNISFQQWDGSTITIPGVAPGLYPFTAIKVFSLNTTITSQNILWAN